MNHRPFLSALLLAASLHPSAAAAATVSDADRATARTLSAEGHEALGKKDYATAADRFTRADGLFHAPTLMLGLARAQVGLGKLVSAQETYRRIIREGVQPGSPPPFFKALDAAKTEVDALAPTIPFVILEVKGSGPAKITIDGVEVPNQALGVKRPIDPGEHVVRATADGYLAAERTVTLIEGKVETVTLELTVAAAQKPASNAKPAAAQRPAEKPIAAVASVAPAPPSSHVGEQKGSTQKKIGITALSVGAAGLVLGGVTGGAALAQHGILAQECTVVPANRCPMSSKSGLDNYTMLGAVSTAGFIAGGAAAALGTVLILTASKSKPKSEAWIAPVVGPGHAGVQGGF